MPVLLEPILSPILSTASSVQQSQGIRLSRTELQQQRDQNRDNQSLQQVATRQEPVAYTSNAANTNGNDLPMQNQTYAAIDNTGGLIASVPTPLRGALLDIAV